MARSLASRIRLAAGALPLVFALTATASAEDNAADRAAFVADVLTIEADPAFGEYLAGQCAACHGSSDGRIPVISGLKADYFVGAIHEYRTGVRDNEVMRSHVGRLSEEEIAALAAFYSEQEAD